jgi:long-subunit fatty acid transport protein
MKTIFIGVLSFITINVYSQSDIIDWLIPPQGFGIPYLNSTGNSAIINDVTNIGVINPASISNFNILSFGISYQINPEIEKGWLNDSPVKRNNQFVPQSAGATYKFDNLSFGLGFNQQYNTRTDFNWNSSGYGEQDITEFEGNVYSYSVVASYSFNEIFKQNSKLNLGLNITYNKVNFSQDDQDILIELTDNAINFIFGLQYSHKNSDDLETSIGISYKTNTKFQSNNQTQSGMTVVIRKTDSFLSINNAQAENIIYGNNPDKFNLDLAVDISSSIKLLASGTGIFWEKDDNRLNDQFEFSLGSVYKINDMFSPAFSIYYTGRNYELGFFDLNEKFDAVFLIAGLKINYGIFYSDLAIADSHLFSGDFRKQTIVKLAIGVLL